MFVIQIAPMLWLVVREVPGTLRVPAGTLAAGHSAGLAGQKKEPAREAQALLCQGPGSDLLSHPVARAVPSALEGLTSVFGMGTGVAPPLWPPGTPKHPESIDPAPGGARSLPPLP